MRCCAARLQEAKTRESVFELREQLRKYSLPFICGEGSYSYVGLNTLTIFSSFGRYEEDIEEVIHIYSSQAS